MLPICARRSLTLPVPADTTAPSAPSANVNRVTVTATVIAGLQMRRGTASASESLQLLEVGEKAGREVIVGEVVGEIGRGRGSIEIDG
jgi:hypothetical protein